MLAFSIIERQLTHCHGMACKEPHWYLNFIGVDVSRQGKGLGAALIEPVLAIVDAAGCLAYLESSNPKNMRCTNGLGLKQRPVCRLVMVLLFTQWCVLLGKTTLPM